MLYILRRPPPRSDDEVANLKSQIVCAVTAVLGAQWGDEGKGKLVDILSADVDICARVAGGNNAGHTIVAPIGPERVKTTFAFHLLPSGALIILDPSHNPHSFRWPRPLQRKEI